MRFIYYYTGAVNGENALGHYIRALVEISNCTPRSSTVTGGCGATFNSTTLGSAADVASVTKANDPWAAGSPANPLTPTDSSLGTDARTTRSGTTATFASTTASKAASISSALTSAKALLNFLLAK